MFRKEGYNIIFEDKKYIYLHWVIFLGILMVLDYAATWYGIRILGVVEEANPLFKDAFNYSFVVSLLFRLVHVSMLMYIFYNLLCYYQHPLIESGTKFSILINILVCVYHYFLWLRYFI